MAPSTRVIVLLNIVCCCDRVAGRAGGMNGAERTPLSQLQWNFDCLDDCLDDWHPAIRLQVNTPLSNTF